MEWNLEISLQSEYSLGLCFVPLGWLPKPTKWQVFEYSNGYIQCLALLFIIPSLGLDRFSTRNLDTLDVWYNLLLELRDLMLEAGLVLHVRVEPTSTKLPEGGTFHSRCSGKKWFAIVLTSRIWFGRWNVIFIVPFEQTRSIKSEGGPMGVMKFLSKHFSFFGRSNSHDNRTSLAGAFAYGDWAASTTGNANAEMHSIWLSRLLAV